MSIVNNPNEEPKCAICLDLLGKTGIVEHKIQEVYHQFHEECLKTWLNINNSCPSCRENAPKWEVNGQATDFPVEGVENPELRTVGIYADDDELPKAVWKKLLVGSVCILGLMLVPLTQFVSPLLASVLVFTGMLIILLKLLHDP